MSNIVRHFFFFNDTATTEIYTLSLHDALPISSQRDADHADHHRRRQADHGLLPRTLPRGSSRHGHRVSHGAGRQSAHPHHHDGDAYKGGTGAGAGGAVEGGAENGDCKLVQSSGKRSCAAAAKSESKG